MQDAIPKLSFSAQLLRLRCPHCGLKALPAWRKWVLGWDKPIACQVCGRPVLIQGLHDMLATSPIVVGSFVLAVWFGVMQRLTVSTSVAVTLLVLMAVAAVLGHVFAVPLSRGTHWDDEALRRASQARCRSDDTSTDRQA